MTPDYYGYTYDYSDTAATGLGVGMIIFFIILGILCLGFAIFELVAAIKMYKKAGKPGWAVIVPVYNMIVLYDIIGYKWYYIFITVLGGIPVVGQLILILFGITSNIKLSKSFGQSTGFGIGLWLVGFIFVPMIAFNKDIKYVGQSVKGDIDFNDLF